MEHDQDQSFDRWKRSVHLILWLISSGFHFATSSQGLVLNLRLHTWLQRYFGQLIQFRETSTQLLVIVVESKTIVGGRSFSIVGSDEEVMAKAVAEEQGWA